VAATPWQALQGGGLVRLMYHPEEVEKDIEMGVVT
jgi:hypothetical protein